jgi:hypothetical protein
VTRFSLRLRLNYPRYTVPLLRPHGAGAFFDFVAEVMRSDTAKLESCSIRRFGLRVAARR